MAIPEKLKFLVFYSLLSPNKSSNVAGINTQNIRLDVAWHKTFKYHI